MIDEIWMRGWADNHGRFSADLDRGFSQIASAWRAWRRRARGVPPSNPRLGAN